MEIRDNVILIDVEIIRIRLETFLQAIFPDKN